MVDVLITHETLYELLRREKSRDEIQKLDDNFYGDVLTYIKDKKAILDSQKSKDNIFSSQEVQKTKKQMDNALEAFNLAGSKLGILHGQK